MRKLLLPLLGLIVNKLINHMCMTVTRCTEWSSKVMSKLLVYGEMPLRLLSHNPLVMQKCPACGHKFKAGDKIDIDSGTVG